MCVLLPAWLWLLLGLLPLEIQSRALTLHSFAHRLTLSRTSKHHKSSFPATMPAASDLPTNFDDLLTQGNRYTIWRSLSHKESLSKLSKPSPDESGVVLQEAPVSQRGSRSRRHANSGGTRGHGHLMRVGCVLGTCQVQNLSHRLYQLIGQSGREDSSPINPRSPHSYG